MARKSRKYPQEETSAPKAVTYAAWGYARISVDGEHSEDSIEGQTAIIKDYADGNADIELRDVITDLGFTGTDFDRPGYAALLEGIKCGEVQCVIVKDLSRVGRTYIEVGELLFDTFPAHNVRFISVNDNYDSFADDAARKKLLILFKNLMNHLYSKDLGVKIRSSFEIKQQKGELLGSLPPYGYLFTTEGGGKRLTTEPESAAVVKLIFDMRAQGDSMVKITEYLNSNGILPPRSHYYRLGILTSEKDAKKTLWQNSYIGHMLRNEVYTGRQIQAKYERHGKKVTERPKDEWIVREGAHPAIVDRAQFDAVQVLLGAAGEKYRKRGNKLDDNILVGKIYCSRCGKALKRGWSGNKKYNKYYYSCHACCAEIRRNTDIEKVSKLKFEEIEKTVCAAIQKNVDACIEIGALLDKAANAAVIRGKRHSLNAELKHCEREAKKADGLLASAYTHHLAGLLDSREFELVRAKFERDKQAAQAGIECVGRGLAEYGLLDAQHSEFISNFRRFNGFTGLDKDMVNILIERIETEPLTKEISVTLNFTDKLDKLKRMVVESGVAADVR